MEKLRDFESLTPHMQKTMREVAYAYYTFKGLDEKKKYGRFRYYTSKPKRYRAWRNKLWIMMQKVDRKREAIGLSKLYTE